MMVKRYVVRDMPEAVVMIRKDLGKDAVILSTKRITLKKWFGVVRNRRLEVLAAAGEDMPIRTTPPNQAMNRAQAYTAMSEQFSARETPSQRQPQPVQATRPDPEPAVPAAQAHPEVKGHSAPAQVQVPANEPVATAPVLEPVHDVPTPDTAASDLSTLQSEIAEVKRLLETSLVDEQALRQPVLKHLIAQGVQTEHLTPLVRQAHRGSPVDWAQAALSERDGLLQALREDLVDLCEARPISATSRIVAFVGPTGVGKTTTIAKLAALQILSGHRKVGLLTTDTYRIAAVEQLRTYARILDIPLEVVYQAEEFEPAMERLRDRDLILIDTAGRNFRQEAHVEEMRELLARTQVDETYLVLSLTSKPQDLDEIAAKFMALPVDKFLFTKLDETSSYGAALNLLYQYRKPLSYLTNGQSVPDDIEVASLEKLISLILEGAA